jgi:LPS-assembly lipoprotein
MLKLMAIAGGALLLTGCLRPLHAPVAGVSGASSTSQQLSGVAIEISGNRLAHYFRNELEFELRGGANAAPAGADAKYRLAVATRQAISSTLLDRVTGLADAATLHVFADYVLYRSGKAEPLTAGHVIAVVSYERSQQRFATIRAARDAEIQAARQLAEQLRTRVVVHLTSNP